MDQEKQLDLFSMLKKKKYSYDVIALNIIISFMIASLQMHFCLFNFFYCFYKNANKVIMYTYGISLK